MRMLIFRETLCFDLYQNIALSPVTSMQKEESPRKKPAIREVINGWSLALNVQS